jgi:hypothetical protein
MKTEAEILETGIKVVDLLAPYAKGGKIGTLLWFVSLAYAVFISGSRGKTLESCLALGSVNWLAIRMAVCCRRRDRTLIGMSTGVYNGPTLYLLQVSLAVLVSARPCLSWS